MEYLELPLADAELPTIPFSEIAIRKYWKGREGGSL